ncbi:MAG TPA: hypothetical protein VKR59_07840 [Terriglobales bacterium]|nr:hypothetical protein [Terriglobales bacterium]
MTTKAKPALDNRASRQETITEYLGDLTGTKLHEMLNALTNINRLDNSIAKVPSTLAYTVKYHKTHDGRFAGLAIGPKSGDADESSWLDVVKVTKTKASKA